MPAPASSTIRAPSPSRDATIGRPAARYACTLLGTVWLSTGPRARLTSSAEAWARIAGMACCGKRPAKCTLFNPRRKTSCRTHSPRPPLPISTRRTSMLTDNSSAALSNVSNACTVPRLPANTTLNPGFKRRAGSPATSEARSNARSPGLGWYSTRVLPAIACTGGTKDFDCTRSRSLCRYIQRTSAATVSSTGRLRTKPVTSKLWGHRSWTQMTSFVRLSHFSTMAAIACRIGEVP